MGKQKRDNRPRKWPSILLGILYLSSIGIFFLPRFALLDGEAYLSIPSYLAFFGGDLGESIDGVYYSLHLNFNYFDLVFFLLILQASFSSFLGRNDMHNQIISLIFGLFGLAVAVASPFFLSIVNAGISSDGLNLAYGYFALIGLLSLCIAGSVVILIQSRIYWKKRLAL